MTEGKQIPISIFNWGPCVVKLKIEPEFKKLLLDEAKLNTEDYRKNLAGILDHETGYVPSSCL